MKMTSSVTAALDQTIDDQSTLEGYASDNIIMHFHILDQQVAKNIITLRLDSAACAHQRKFCPEMYQDRIQCTYFTKTQKIWHCSFSPKVTSFKRDKAMPWK